MAKWKRYSRDFQLEAAKLVVEQDYSRTEVAARLGVSAWSVGKWVKLFQESGDLAGAPDHEDATSPPDELGRLRREVDKLRVENEILKKATAYFAKESL